MRYPSHPNLSISLRIPNQFPLSLVDDLQLIEQHQVCPPCLSVLTAAAGIWRS